MTEKIYKGLDKLNPKFKIKVEKFLSLVGDKIFITESWRSQKRQEELYAQGRTTPGAIITWTLNSNHTKGFAIDIAFKGKTPYPGNKNDWIDIANVASECGISRGYAMRGKDMPHFEDNFYYDNNEENMITNKYDEVFKTEVTDPIFSTHEGGEALSEAQVKKLLEIGFARLEKRFMALYTEKIDLIIELLREYISTAKQ